MRRVAVLDWPIDGFALQGRENPVVEKCTAIGNRGHRFHPGTGVAGGELPRCLSRENGGDGLHYRAPGVIWGGPADAARRIFRGGHEILGMLVLSRLLTYQARRYGYRAVRSRRSPMSGPL